MMQNTNKRTLMLGITIILLTNAIALTGVAYNRSGNPTSLVTLTERELSLPYETGFAAENSGISLRLRWRTFDRKTTAPYYYGSWEQAEWLDKDKLKTLGFDVSYPLDTTDSYLHYRRILSREVYLVLEYDGESYRKQLQVRRKHQQEALALLVNNPDKKEFESRLKNANESLKAEQYNNSRLFVIDAGLEHEELRQRYKDKTKFVLARGQISMSYQGTYNKNPYLRGIIRRLSVSKVNVPLEHSGVIAPLLEEGYRREIIKRPRYQVSLKYGLRFEPWVELIQELTESNSHISEDNIDTKNN